MADSAILNITKDTRWLPELHCFLYSTIIAKAETLTLRIPDSQSILHALDVLNMRLPLCWLISL